VRGGDTSHCTWRCLSSRYGPAASAWASPPSRNTARCFWHGIPMPHPQCPDPENAGTSTSWSTTMARFRKGTGCVLFPRDFFSVFDSISYGARSSLPRRTYYQCCTVGNAMRTRPSERTKNGGRGGKKSTEYHTACAVDLHFYRSRTANTRLQYTSPNKSTSAA
jgi:hypothetical protein